MSMIAIIFGKSNHYKQKQLRRDTLIRQEPKKDFFMNEKEITGIENAAVTNFAEMLCDYVSGLDEGEGIGREDIINHLYEYINWDKRFTREYEEGKRNFKPF